MKVAMSSWVSWPARVEACDDWMRAAVALLASSACSPRHCADSYVLQAVATAAMASRTVARNSSLWFRPSSTNHLGEGVDRAGDDERDHRQRYQRLQRHGQLRPMHHGHHVRRTERGARGQPEHEVVDIHRAPSGRRELRAELLGECEVGIWPWVP